MSYGAASRRSFPQWHPRRMTRRAALLTAQVVQPVDLRDAVVYEAGPGRRGRVRGLRWGEPGRGDVGDHNGDDDDWHEGERVGWEEDADEED